jgi:uncharacterized protein with GYD domain
MPAPLVVEQTCTPRPEAPHRTAMHAKGVEQMPMYVGLYKFTAKGAGDMKSLPERINESIKTWEAMGGKTTAVLATMGRYDLVTIGEAPSDEMAATFAAGLAARGYVTTETLRAFTVDEIGALLAKLP